jgi:hypothetical protein
MKVKKQTEKTFKFVKPIKFGDNSKPTLVAIFGYPFKLKKYFDYNGNFYYIDSHYNNALIYPSPFLNIKELSEIIVNELISKLKTKDVILIGYSLGSAYSLEISKILEKNNISVKFQLLIDPIDEIYNFNNKLYNKLKYYFCFTVLFSRYLIFSFITKLQNIFNFKIIIRSTYINSIYRIHLLRYNFSYSNINTILIKNLTNCNKTKYGWIDIFKKDKIDLRIFEAKNHSDFFFNKNILKKWINMLKINI